MVEIAFIGSGTMGAGIAESAALAGMSTIMLDVREDALARGRESIERDLSRRMNKGWLSDDERREVLGRVSTTTSLEDCAAAALVVEAGLLGRKSGRGFYDYGAEEQGQTAEKTETSEDLDH